MPNQTSFARLRKDIPKPNTMAKNIKEPKNFRFNMEVTVSTRGEKLNWRGKINFSK
jgi:hypothetical protein